MASCVKNRDHDTLAAEDATFALWVYDDAINIANEASRLATGEHLALYKTSGYCATVTNNPGQIIVDFDTVNCLCNDGRMRRGKVIMNYTGEYKDSNETRTITFDNYYVNDHHIKGDEVITGLGNSLYGVPLYSVEVTGVIDVEDTLGSLTYRASIERKWAAGSQTIQYDDDYYELKGTAQGVNIYGNNYAFNTASPIVKPTSITCRFFTEGILEVQPQGRTFRSIDYGDGNCDDIATVTIDRKQHNMILK
jgi:hypothetical protein